MLSSLTAQARQAAGELCDLSRIRPGELLVVGCSTSEAAGSLIGTNSSLEIAQAILDGILPVLTARGVLLAAQCCEHLGRALVVEAEAAQRHNLEIVNAIPQPKAGGSFATAAYHAFECPAVVDTLACRAAAGMDIGGTLIGMHLRRVAVPVRLSIRRIGEAPLICARTRPRFVGGSRAVYDETLM